MNIKKVISIILVIIWMSVVFLFSNQQGEKSGGTSRKVSAIVVNIINIQNKYNEIEKEELINILEPIIRKLAHYTIYMIGGVILANCVFQFCQKHQIAIYISLFIGVLYAISDEIHQLMVIGRSGNIKDVIIDSLGILTGNLFFLLITKLIKVISKKRRNKGGEQSDCGTI